MKWIKFIIAGYLFSVALFGYGQFNPNNPNNPGKPVPQQPVNPGSPQPPPPANMNNSNLKQQVKPIISGNTQALLTEDYQLKYYESTLFVTLQQYRDDIRIGQRIGVTILFTDGTASETMTRDVDEVFRITGTAYDQHSSREGMMELKFRGAASRIHNVEIVIFENTRRLYETEDHADLGYKIWIRTIDMKDDARVWVDHRLLVADTLSHIAIHGSGVIRTPVLNPMKNYPTSVKTELPHRISFSILNAGDPMKSGFTQAKFLIKLKDGGVIETDIPQGTKNYFLIRGETTQNIHWNDIKQIGIRYKFPSTLANRDDWVIRGLTVSYKSFKLGPVRIYTEWDMERKFNGDGEGTTWWSNDLALP